MRWRRLRTRSNGACFFAHPPKQPKHSSYFGWEEGIDYAFLHAMSPALKDRLSIEPASEVVDMGEPPAQALRNKKDSSMRVSLNLVKSGRAQACVSAGNTGALMATARFVLKMLPGIDRPAIITAFPTYTNRVVRLLDLGANVDSTPEHLAQFALMGSILVSAVEKKPNPTVALLNIGEEAIKGNELVKKTADLLVEQTEINYTGYIEANAIFQGHTDVVVCDGFVGNVTLKAIEGVAKLLAQLAKDAFSSWWTKCLILPALPILRKKIMNRINPESHNGATFLGLNGIVVKSHGGASVNAFAQAIREAVLEMETNVSEQIKTRLHVLLETKERD